MFRPAFIALGCIMLLVAGAHASRAIDTTEGEQGCTADHNGQPGLTQASVRARQPVCSENKCEGIYMHALCI